MAYRYRNTQGVRISIPDAGSVEVDPGEEFSSEQLLVNDTLAPADAATRSAHKAGGREAAATQPATADIKPETEAAPQEAPA